MMLLRTDMGTLYAKQKINFTLSDKDISVVTFTEFTEVN